MNFWTLTILNTKNYHIQNVNCIVYIETQIRHRIHVRFNFELGAFLYAEGQNVEWAKYAERPSAR